MSKRSLHIDADVRRAFTLPGNFYSSGTHYSYALERVFLPSWQAIPDVALPDGPAVAPFTLLPNLLDEPLLLARGRDGAEQCLSNVCTHRGNLLVEEPSEAAHIRCRYHGRRFDLDGRCVFMPEFGEVEGFPSKADHLPAIGLDRWGPVRFVRMGDGPALADILAAVTERVGWLPFETLSTTPHQARDYTVNAHWALYCDNYLEGFHIPYVHESLNDVLDYGSYETECFDHGSLQVGIADDGEDTFDLPVGHPDAGRHIAAYYFWIYPNTMLNVYPWGLSLNVVLPEAIDRTRIQFRSYVLDESRVGTGAGADLDRVELEDEAVVEAVAKGTRSRLYTRGRFSPRMEPGVHHFHRMLARDLA